MSLLRAAGINSKMPEEESKMDTDPPTNITKPPDPAKDDDTDSEKVT